MIFNYFNVADPSNEHEVVPKGSAKFTRSDQIQSAVAEVVACTLKGQERYIQKLQRALQKAETTAAAAAETKPEATTTTALSSSDSVSSLVSNESGGSGTSARISSLQEQLEKVEKAYADLHCLAFEVWTNGRRNSNDKPPVLSTTMEWTIADKSVATHVIEAIMEELDARIQQDEKLIRKGFSTMAQAAAVKAHAELACLAGKVWRSEDYFPYRSQIANILLSTAEQTVGKK